MSQPSSETELEKHEKLKRRRNSLNKNLKHIRLSEFTVGELDIVLRILGFSRTNFPMHVLESEMEKLEQKLKERRLGVHSS